MKTRSEVTHEDDRYVYGKTFVQMNDGGPWEFTTNWMRTKTDFWFVGQPHEVLERIGVKTEQKRAREFVDLINGEINGFYYLSAATPKGTGDEALKWIMSAVAAKLNELGWGFERAADVMPADYLHTFVEYLSAGKFEKSFAKDVFAELMRKSHGRNRHDWDADGVWYHYYIDHENHREIQTHTLTWEEFCALPITPLTPEQWENEGGDPDKYDPTSTFDIGMAQSENFKGRYTGPEMMDKIIADPRFKAVESSEIDSIIDSVLAANPENAEKVKSEPKLIQWFVGQVMKAAKGKAPAPVVLEKLKGRFGG